MARKVIVASSVSNQAKRLETDVTTWGELKAQISDLLTGGVEAVVKPGNITLRGDDSVLPQGDFNVYLIPTKNKAGQYYDDDDLRRLSEDLTRAINKAADRIVAAIKNEEAPAESDLDKALREAKELG